MMIRPMKEKVHGLLMHVRQMPQVEPETRHYYAKGLYGRELVHGPGVVLVGRVHKKEHFFILTKGKVRVTLGEDVEELEAPHVLVCEPGTQRTLFSEEGCVYMTVHRTDKKNLEKIARELTEESPFAVLDAGNRMKVLT